MSVSHGDIRDLGRRTERAARSARRSEWYENLARAGFAAKGFVYAVVAVLAVRAAFGSGGAPEGSKGAVREVAQLGTFGEIVVFVLAIGLAAYALFRFVEAALGSRGDDDAKSTGKRIGRAISGLIYAGLSVWTFQLVIGAPNAEGGGAQRWTALLMAQPFGRWLVGIAGVAVGIFGAFLLVKAWRSDVGKHLDTARMRARTREAAIASGRAGYASRGVVFVLMGVFLVQAAATYDPSEARGLAGALQAIQATTWGPWLLGVVAVGLLAYAAFCIVRARWFKLA